MISKTFADFANVYTIFLNKNVLKNGYTPESLDKVMHRDETIDQYMYYLKDAMIGNVPDNILVTGKVGVGKTMLTTLLTTNLIESASLIGINVHVIYIYCENLTANASILRYINANMPVEEGTESKKVGMSVAVNFNYFCKLLNNYNGIIIIVLDEIDQLADPNIINRFARVKENSFSNKNVCLIGITNKTKFTERLEPKTKAVISQNEIIIPPYNAIELGDILKLRAETALKPGVLPEASLRYCAGIVAQDAGDARKAIGLLRVSADIVDKDGKGVIEESDIRLASVKLEEELTLSVIKTMPAQSLLALYAASIEGIRHNGCTATIGEIYLTYIKICESTNYNVLTQRRILDLLSELEYMEVIDNIDVKSSGRYGRSSNIRLGDLKKCQFIRDWVIPYIEGID